MNDILIYLQFSSLNITRSVIRYLVNVKGILENNIISKENARTKLGTVDFAIIDVDGKQNLEEFLRFLSNFDKLPHILFYSAELKKIPEAFSFFTNNINNANNKYDGLKTFVSGVEVISFLSSFDPDISISKEKNYFKKVSHILRHENTNDKIEILKLAGEQELTIQYHAKESTRNKSFHDASQIDIYRRISMIDMVTEYIYSEKWFKGFTDNPQPSRMKILWLENAPGKPIKEHYPLFHNYAINNLLPEITNKAFLHYINHNILYHLSDIQEVFDIFEIYIISSDYEKLYIDLLKEGKETAVNAELISASDNLENNGDLIRINDFDFFVVDLYLGNEDESYNDGENFVKLFTLNFPQIPIAMLSGTEDDEKIDRCYRNGADFFLNKKQIYSFPKIIHKIYDKYGVIIWLLFNNPKLKKNLLGNIRYWMQHENLLWYGDKCYHMIEHGYKHTIDNWKATNQVLLFIYDKLKEEYKDKAELDNDLYSFCMAMWLHDIGHKGNVKYGNAHDIRDTHGIIAGELIARMPHLFNISDYKDFTPYENTTESIVTSIYKKKKKKLSNFEKIALFAIFHKSNAPLTPHDASNLKSNNKLPDEYILQRSKSVITLEDILSKRSDEGLFLLTYASLFRFIDGIDIHATRVGDITEKALKLAVIQQDKKFNFNKLDTEMQSILNTADPSKKKELNSLFEKIKSQLVNLKLDELKETKNELNNFCEISYNRLINIIDYTSFISVQDGHFNLHSCVDDIKIVFENYKKQEIINFVYKLNKDIDWLHKNQVREMKLANMSIFNKLFGSRDFNRNILLPYPLNELKDGIIYLKSLLNLEAGLKLTIVLPNNRDIYFNRDILAMLKKEGLAGLYDCNKPNITIWRLFAINKDNELIIKESGYN